MELTIKAQEVRREYFRVYRKAHKKNLKVYLKNWKMENKDKVQQYNVNFWNKKAAEANTLKK